MGNADDGRIWLKITLKQVHCVKSVIKYLENGSPQFIWTCSSDDCKKCEQGGGRKCEDFELSVNIEGHPSVKTSSERDCKLGNSVLLEDFEPDSIAMGIYEIAVIQHDSESYNQLSKIFKKGRVSLTIIKPLF